MKGETVKAVDKKKLAEIQKLAIRYNRQLTNDRKYGREVTERGGMLLLGNHYAVSDKLFFGLNPRGFDENTKGKFIVESIPENGPWQIVQIIGDTVKPDEPYWKHCARFFNSDDYLSTWISDATSAFLIPWRTTDARELYSFDLFTEMLNYSKSIVLKMIDHHKPRVIIVAGKDCMDIIKAFLSYLQPTVYVVDSKRAKGKYGNQVYQWGYMVANNIAVYQVPHFSRASSGKALKDCAKWLSKEIQGVYR